jgi:hypothetical protein
VPRWGRWWKVWVALGVAAELVSLKWGTPLTQVARKYLLHSPLGSMLAGAFLLWLPAHWLLIAEGLGWADIVALIVGAVVGLVGWRVRHDPQAE